MMKNNSKLVEEEKKGSVFKRIGPWLLNLLFPKHLKCVFCGNELKDDNGFDTCEHCEDSLPKIQHACLRCGGIVEESNDGVCLNCKSNNFDFNSARSVFHYKDSIVGLMHRYKFGRAKYLYEPMAQYMCDVLSKWGINVDFVTCVPLHKNREKTRGYNQSKLLAEFIAEKFGLKYVDTAEKIVDNSSQTSLGMKQRKANVLGVYKLLSEARHIIKGKNILLIDDIFTTGATSNEMSSCLKKAGAKEIFVLTFAHSVGLQN